MYLGLDLGTSGLKGVMIDENGEIIASHTAALTVSRPQAGWSEQNPKDWIVAARTVLEALAPKFGGVRAIGLSGQMHGAVCLDQNGDVIRPAILWNDTRATAEAAALDAQASLKEIFGNITFAGFTAPKILWLKTNEPDNYKQIATVLLPKDYLRYWLTGEFVSDLSDASGTAWLDIGARKWSEPLLAASGLTPSHMPNLVEGSAASGRLRRELANRYGFASEIVVAGGGGDNAASAIGLGIEHEGEGFVSLGTSGVVFAASSGFIPAPESALHAFCHALPDTWHQMGVTLSATDSLNWFARLFAEDPAELVAGLGALEAPSAELFLPFLGGERTPYNTGALRASFHGLSHSTDLQALTRAILEGVCFSLKTCLELIEESSGEVKTLYAVGGGAKSDYWLRLMATILGKDIRRPEGADNVAAIGAAKLGAMSIGESFITKPSQEIFRPQRALAGGFQQKYQAYLSEAENG